MQEGDIEAAEEPLYYQLPLSRILAWNRWWHITAKVILIAYQKRFWGLLGQYLQEVRGIQLAHVALLRRSWATGRGTAQKLVLVKPRESTKKVLPFCYR